MFDDDKEVQTQVEEAFHVLPQENIRHSDCFVDNAPSEVIGSDQLSAKYCNRYEIVIITEMVISNFTTYFE